jgi:hypothetical protein
MKTLKNTITHRCTPGEKHTDLKTIKSFKKSLKPLMTNLVLVVHKKKGNVRFVKGLFVYASLISKLRPQTKTAANAKKEKRQLMMGVKKIQFSVMSMKFKSTKGTLITWSNTKR